MAYLKGLSDISRTQVLAKGMNLKGVLKEDFLKEMKNKLGDSYEDIVVADLRLMLIPKLKETPMKEDEKGIFIQLANADFIRFEQPSPNHYRDQVVVITSNRKDNLDKVLK